MTDDGPADDATASPPEHGADGSTSGSVPEAFDGATLADAARAPPDPASDPIADVGAVPDAPDHDGIGVTGLEKSYSAVDALRGIDLEVAPGSFHCLVGPNGSGKTTLFRLLLGLTRPTAGRIDRPDVRLGVGFQHRAFYSELTVDENVSVFSGLAGGVDDDWRSTLFELLGLDSVGHRVAGELSGGYGKKLDLALALLRRPPVVLLDEPLGNLDDVSKRRLLAFLDRYRDAGHTVVVSTHHVVDFAPLVDHLTVLYDGELLLDERRDDLELGEFDSLQELYVARILERETDVEE